MERAMSDLVKTEYVAGPGSVESSLSSATDSADSALPETSAAELICAVCGDGASGFHYDVPSCNGCKTFFRRTVVMGRKFVCKNGGNCQFDKNRRCACRSCRMDACTSAGMNAQAIQYTPSANLTLSIARKRFQRSFRSSALIDVPKPLANGEHDLVLQCIDQVLHLDEKFDRLRCSTFYNYDADIRIEDLLSRPSTIGDASKYPVVEKWPARPAHVSMELEELQRRGLKFWFYNDLYLSVEYAKSLPVFQQLTTNDKIILILDTALKDTYLSSGYFSHNKRAEEIIYPDGWRPFLQKESLIEIEKVLRRGIVPQLNNLKPDQIQFSLLRAICTLNYACAELSDDGRDLISSACSKYTKALLRYLQNKHGTSLGTRRFSESMALLTILCQKVKNNYDYYAFRRCVLQIPPPSNLFHEIMSKDTLP